MTSRSDSPDVGKLDDEHLRRFVAAREAGDAGAMRRWWEELVITLFARIDGIVAVTHRGQLNDDEHDDAVALAMTRVSRNLILTFNGTSMGELVNATKTLASFACIDVQRASMRQPKSVSLDDGWRTDDADRAAPAWEAGEARDRYRRAEHAADMEAFREWAVPQLSDDQRRVVEMTFDGYPVGEICDALGVSRDNAYQLRSRGLKHLGKLLVEFEADR